MKNKLIIIYFLMIEGIFFSEFDNNAGPVIRFQDPDGYVRNSSLFRFIKRNIFYQSCISAESFEHISEYVITKSVLCYRNICIS